MSGAGRKRNNLKACPSAAADNCRYVSPPIPQSAATTRIPPPPQPAAMTRSADSRPPSARRRGGHRKIAKKSAVPKARCVGRIRRTATRSHRAPLAPHPVTLGPRPGSVAAKASSRQRAQYQQSQGAAASWQGGKWGERKEEGGTQAGGGWPRPGVWVVSKVGWRRCQWGLGGDVGGERARRRK